MFCTRIIRISWRTGAENVAITMMMFMHGLLYFRCCCRRCVSHLCVFSPGLPARSGVDENVLTAQRERHLHTAPLIIGIIEMNSEPATLFAFHHIERHPMLIIMCSHVTRIPRWRARAAWRRRRHRRRRPGSKPVECREQSFPCRK